MEVSGDRFRGNQKAIAKVNIYARFASVAMGIVTGLHFTLGAISQAWIGPGDWARLTYAWFVALLVPSFFFYRKRFTTIDIAVILYVTLYVSRLFWNQRDEEDFVMLVGLYSAGLAACYVVLSRFLSSTPHAELFVWVFCVTLALGCLLISTDLQVTQTGRSILASDPESNPVGLSVALLSGALVAMAITFAVLRNDGVRPLTRVGIGSVAVSLTVFLAWQAMRTGTRSVILALYATVIFLILLVPRKKRLSTYGFVAIIGGGAAVAGWFAAPLIGDLIEHVLPAPVGQRYAEFLVALGREGFDAWVNVDLSALARTELWRTYWECFTESPVWGCGPRLGEVSRAPVYAHNAFLAAAGELGVAGLAALGVAVACALFSVRLLVEEGGAGGWVAAALLVGGFLQLQFSLELPVAKHFVVGLAMVEGLRTRRPTTRSVLATQRPLATLRRVSKEGGSCGIATAPLHRLR